jgi:hypothetical protein
MLVPEEIVQYTEEYDGLKKILCRKRVTLSDRFVHDTDAKHLQFYLRLACENGDVCVINRLLQDHRVDPSAGNNYAIQTVVEKGWFDATRVLLQHELVNPGDFDNLALRVAVRNNNVKLVSLLLAHPKVDASAKGNEAIKVAILKNYTDVALLLLSRPEVDPSVHDNILLCAACMTGDDRMAFELLRDPRLDPSRGYVAKTDSTCIITPLSVARHAGRPDLVALIEATIQSRTALV